VLCDVTSTHSHSARTFLRKKKGEGKGGSQSGRDDYSDSGSDTSYRNANPTGMVGIAPPSPAMPVAAAAGGKQVKLLVRLLSPSAWCQHVPTLAAECDFRYHQLPQLTHSLGWVAQVAQVTELQSELDERADFEKAQHEQLQLLDFKYNLLLDMLVARELDNGAGGGDDDF
jgi:hypothetical protein